MLRYGYDADNRIKWAESSTNGIHWDRDATYFYYLHGPLSRVELGNKKVQGLDYAYTLNGWIKGVNSATLTVGRDMGHDSQDLPAPGPFGISGEALHSFVGRDSMGFELGYYQDDFKPIFTHVAADHPFAALGGTALSNQRDLYNGNIGYMVTALKQFSGTTAPEPILKQFTYDQLNRIKGMTTYTGTGIVANNSWLGATTDGAYSTAYSYDGNGNIDTLIRQGKSGLLNMDHLIYHYDKEVGTDKLLSNRLYHVKDNAGATPGYTDDLELLTSAPGSNLSTTGNYGYDEIGNLIRDDAEGIQDIEWDVYGKILSIDKVSDDDISFGYDAGGNRALKRVDIGSHSGTDPDITYYVRDATGNPIAIYRRHRVNTDYELQLNELVLYGSERLGMLDCDLTLHSQPQASGGNVNPPSGNRFAADNSGNSNLAISQLVYDSPYAKANPGSPNKGEALLLRNLSDAPVNLLGLDIEAPLSSQTYTPASTLTVPAHGRIAFVNGDETNSTEKTDILDALGFSAADLADTSLLVVWHQSLSLDNAGETLRLTYQKAPTDSIQLVDELSYGNAIGGIDSLSALQHDSLWAYAPAPNALRRTSFGGAGNTFRTSAYTTSAFRGEGINIPTPLGPILANATYADHERGKRLYELKNHLGNVTTVVSDRKVPYFHSSTGDLVYFSPDIASAQDYYPFGSIMPGRSFSSGYRYGFNGKEQDPETYGTGNIYDYGFRIYNPRLAKFLSVDPLAPEYPWYTPYQFAGNMPIAAIDLDGLEPEEITKNITDPNDAILNTDNLGDIQNLQNLESSSESVKDVNSEALTDKALRKGIAVISRYAGTFSLFFLNDIAANSTGANQQNELNKQLEIQQNQIGWRATESGGIEIFKPLKPFPSEFYKEYYETILKYANREDDNEVEYWVYELTAKTWLNDIQIYYRNKRKPFNDVELLPGETYKFGIAKDRGTFERSMSKRYVGAQAEDMISKISWIGGNFRMYFNALQIVRYKIKGKKKAEALEKIFRYNYHVEHGKYPPGAGKQ